MPKDLISDSAAVPDLEDRLEALEYWVVTLLAAHLRANPDMPAAQDDFDTRPMPHPGLAEGTVRDVLEEHPDVSADEIAPLATDKAEETYRAISLILERARASYQNDR